MTKESYYRSVVLDSSTYDRLVQAASRNHDKIERMAEKLAEEKIKEWEGRVEVTIYHDRDGSFESVYANPKNQISHELEPLAQHVKYWIDEIAMGRLHQISKLKETTEQLNTSNLRLITLVVFLCVALVLAIIF